MPKEKKYTDVQYKEIIHFCATNNSVEFNTLKAIEEATEFNEALVKYQTKHPDNAKRPPKIEILKEYGDFMYRGMILIKQLFPELNNDQLEEALFAHVQYKLGKLISYKETGKYKGGL